jgi:hypothetical protein
MEGATIPILHSEKSRGQECRGRSWYFHRGLVLIYLSNLLVRRDWPFETRGLPKENPVKTPGRKVTQPEDQHNLAGTYGPKVHSLCRESVVGLPGRPPFSNPRRRNIFFSSPPMNSAVPSGRPV